MEFDHLFIGTQSDNMKDAGRKGRTRLQRRPEETQGENHPGAKLTAMLVREIRARKGSATTYELANEYGVSQSTIHQIHIGKTWKSV